MRGKALALDAYEKLAEAFAAHVDTKSYNAFYERPATLGLLPPIAGLRVLDAGCGPGAYTEWLVEHGAEVVGIDVSPRMVELANQRLKGRASIVHADLGAPLDFLESASFDLILSPLVPDYIEDWHALFSEFFRLLRATGYFVFSVGHPFDEFFSHHPEGNYFAIEQIEWGMRMGVVSVRVPYYRRPLQALLDPLLDAGFILDRLVEPRPVPQFREHDPEDYEKLMRRPGFLCVRAKKGMVG
jgi:SAM-dependent methyltransferase